MDDANFRNNSFIIEKTIIAIFIPIMIVVLLLKSGIIESNMVMNKTLLIVIEKSDVIVFL